MVRKPQDRCDLYSPSMMRSSPTSFAVQLTTQTPIVEITYEAGKDKFFTKPVIAKDLIDAVKASFKY